MTVLFLSFFRSDLSKLDQTWSNFLSKLDQTWSNLIKLDQIWFPHQSKNVSIKICHIYRKDKNGCFVFWFFFGSDPSKMDQTWSNLIKLDFLANLKMLLWKVVTFPERIIMDVLFLILLDQICPKWIKLDQIAFSPIKKCYRKKLSHLQKG